jgi:hypothetical protein
LPVAAVAIQPRISLRADNLEVTGSLEQQSGEELGIAMISQSPEQSWYEDEPNFERDFSS